MLYNVFWTALPPLFTFILERDVDSKFSLKYPILYSAGPMEYYFNYKLFWKWMFQALYHGFLVFFIIQYGLEGTHNSTGMTQEHWFTSTVSFSIVLHIATYKLLLESSYWNVYQMLSVIFSLLAYYIILFIGCMNSIAIIF